MTKVERKPKYNINTITPEQMADIGLEENYIDDIVYCRKVFNLKLDDSDYLIKLEKLWESLGMTGFTADYFVAKNGDKFRRAKQQAYNKWCNEFALVEVKSEIYDKTSDAVKTRGRPKLNYYITADGAYDLAMLTRNDIGKAVRRSFIAIRKLCNCLINYHQGRMEVHQPSKAMYHLGCKKGGVEIGKMYIKKLHRIMVKLIGYRNAFDTDLPEYRKYAPVVATMLENGKTEEFIISALS